MPEPPITLHCFPSADEPFRRTAEALLERLGDGVAIADLEARLREAYPEAEVHARNELASLGYGQVWYVMREAQRPVADSWRVLVVEDDAGLVRVMTDAIASEGADVRSARNGQLALEVAESWPPDVVVLDLSLPILDGAGFAAAYTERRGEVPIVVISASPEVAQASVEIGARAWLPKPFELQDLIDAVRAHRTQPAALA